MAVGICFQKFSIQHVPKSTASTELTEPVQDIKTLSRIQIDGIFQLFHQSIVFHDIPLKGICNAGILFHSTVSIISRVLIESVSFENSNNICLDSFDHSSKRQQITVLEVIMSYNHDYLI